MRLDGGDLLVRGTKWSTVMLGMQLLDRPSDGVK